MQSSSPAQSSPVIGVTIFPVHAARSSPSTGRRYRGHTVLKRTLLKLVPGNGLDSAPSSPPQMLHWQALPGPRSKLLQFHSFVEAYGDPLRARGAAPDA